ncbi:MAG TPA: hypothetical protein VNR87_17845 [Flavisolibacter sp.]|nr:hypothetical protein [Flavisolibacter sp.]
MKRLLTLTGLSVIFLLSCQKEVNVDLDGTANNGGLLVQIGSKTDADTTTTTFGYNSSKKLVTIKTEGMSGGQSVSNSQRLIRNSQGVVTSIISKSPGLSQYGLDSLITVVHSDASGKYTSQVTTIDLILLVIRDSVALVYSGTNVSKEVEYIDDGTGYSEFGKTEFTYSGNNVSSVKVSLVDDNGGYETEYILNYTYDDKVSPLILGNEGLAFGFTTWFSANNIIKADLQVPSDPTQNVTITKTYTYNAAKKPLTAISVEPGGSSTRDIYTYQ